MSDYKALYEQKKTTAAGIAAQVQSGDVITTELAGVIPVELLDAIADRCIEGSLTDLRWDACLDVEPTRLISPEAAKNVKIVSWFSGGQLRKAVNEGWATSFGCYYRDASVLHRIVPCTDFLVRVCPMDENGDMYVGLNGSFANTMFEKAERIFVEVNSHMPRAVNAPKINIKDVTALYESDKMLPIVPSSKLDDISSKIAGFIAEEIPDGACIQLGIGAVPDAVGVALADKKHLGIHTEMLTDSMIGLIECGAVDNSMKEINRGKTVATFGFGSQRMYDYINNNPDCVFGDVEYVNNPEVIALHSNFISINAALEVDFCGQVCAESVGYVHVSGSGGQADFVRGAIQSKGGKSFIAFPSAAKKDTISKIKPILTPGAVVTTNKNDTDMIVTEYGIAKLRGKSLSERTKALIAIAHPNFRDELTFEAKKMNIII